MDTNTILLIVNLVLSALSPFLTSMAYFIKHIKRCKICNSEISLRSSDIKRKPSDDSKNSPV